MKNLWGLLAIGVVFSACTQKGTPQTLTSAASTAATAQVTDPTSLNNSACASEGAFYYPLDACTAALGAGQCVTTVLTISGKSWVCYGKAGTIPTTVAANAASMSMAQASPISSQILQNAQTVVATKTIYREYQISSGLHLSTPTSGEGGSAYHVEGALFNAYSSQWEPTMIPIYRCKLGNGHFATNSPTCEGVSGAVLEMVIAWAHSVPVTGEVPLYRQVNSTTGDHLETLDSIEGIASLGYRADVIVAYVLPLTFSATTLPVHSVQTVNVYREYNSSAGQHLSTLTSGEGGPSFTVEGAIFKLYSAQYDTDMVPLWRCSVGAGVFSVLKRFSTTALNCESVSGAQLDGLLGWIHSTAHSGEVPFYRRARASYGDHLDTLDITEGTSTGFTTDCPSYRGVTTCQVGYVLPHS